jgi:hypothetical protein
MVAEAAENTAGRTKARQRSHHLSLGCGIVGDVVAGQRHQVTTQIVNVSTSGEPFWPPVRSRVARRLEVSSY